MWEADEEEKDRRTGPYRLGESRKLPPTWGKSAERGRSGRELEIRKEACA